MVKMLTRVNGKLLLEVDQAMLDDLRISADTPLDVRTVDGRLVVEPQRDPLSDEEFQRAVERVNERYAETFRRLAE